VEMRPALFGGVRHFSEMLVVIPNYSSEPKLSGVVRIEAQKEEQSPEPPLNTAPRTGGAPYRQDAPRPAKTDRLYKTC